MLRQWKTRFALFVVALALALTGFVAQAPSAYAGNNIPGTGPRLHPVGFDPDQTVVVSWGNIPGRP